MAGSVGELNLLLTANAGPMLAAVKLATTACKNYESAASSSMANAAKKAEEYAAKSVQALTRLGKAPVVSGPGTLSDGLRRSAEAAAAVIRSEYPALAREMERQKRALVRITASGDMLVAARDAKGKIGYRTVDGLANDPAAQKAMRDAEERAKAGPSRVPAMAAGAALAAGAAVGATVYAGVGGMVEADKAARSLGIHVRELNALMVWGGRAADQMAGAIRSVSLAFAAAGRGNVEATRTFRALGIDAGAGGPAGIVGKFALVAEKIRGIEQPLRRAGAAARLLGAEAAAQLMPLLMRGGEGVASGEDMAKRLGLAVRDGDVENAQRVAATMRNIQSLGTGLMTQLTAGVAPFVNALAEAFDGFRLDISGMSDAIIDVAEAAARVGGMAIEAWSDTSMVELAWSAAGMAIEAVVMRATVATIGAATDAAGGAIEGLKALMELGGLGWVAESAKLATDLAGAFAKGGAQKRADEAAGNAAWEWEILKFKFDGTQTAKDLDALFGGMRERMGFEMKLFPEEAPVWIDQLLQKFRSMGEALTTPLEAFRERLGEIDGMNLLGLFDGDPILEARARVKAFRDMAGAAAVSGPNFAGATALGSKEDYSAMAFFRSENRRNTVQEEMKAIAEQQARDAAETARLNQLILNVLEGMAEAEEEDL